MKNLNVKDIRKAAFAVGMGFTLGKFCGQCIFAAMSGAWIGTVKGLAKHGNEFCQGVCERTDIKYEEDEKEES